MFDRSSQLQDRWLALPCDLRPGETASIEIDAIGAPDEVRLCHALQGVPMVEVEEWARAELRHVR